MRHDIGIEIWYDIWHDHEYEVCKNEVQHSCCYKLSVDAFVFGSLLSFFRFSVVASDGWYNDTAQVLIQLININDWDPKFRYTDYSFYVGKVKNWDQKYLQFILT